MEVEFNEGQIENYGYQAKKSYIATFFIKMGLAKDDEGAKKIMIIVTVACFLLSFYFFYKAFN